MKRNIFISLSCCKQRIYEASPLPGLQADLQPTVAYSGGLCFHEILIVWQNVVNKTVGREFEKKGAEKAAIEIKSPPWRRQREEVAKSGDINLH